MHQWNRVQQVTQVHKSSASKRKRRRVKIRVDRLFGILASLHIPSDVFIDKIWCLLKTLCYVDIHTIKWTNMWLGYINYYNDKRSKQISHICYEKREKKKDKNINSSMLQGTKCSSMLNHHFIFELWGNTRRRQVSGDAALISSLLQGVMTTLACQ